MYHIFFIAKNNVKKQKGDIITLIVLSLLASFLLYTGASVLTDLGKEMDRAKSKLNNPGFVQKAPAQLVEAEREKLAANEQKAKSLENRISELKESI